MVELIVRIARALACVMRLKILSALARQKEMAPSALARELGVGMDGVCVHLRRLSDAALIRRRRSGIWCYSVADSPYRADTLSGGISRWIRKVLADPLRTMKDCRVDQLCNLSSQASPAEAEASVHRLIFEGLTAFTNVRRLQVLRVLDTVKGISAETLATRLHMSESAVSRHMDKLIRRGYVRVARVGHRLIYRLSKEYKSALHRDLYNIVTKSLDEERLHS